MANIPRLNDVLEQTHEILKTVQEEAVRSSSDGLDLKEHFHRLDTIQNEIKFSLSEHPAESMTPETEKYIFDTLGIINSMLNDVSTQKKIGAVVNSVFFNQLRSLEGLLNQLTDTSQRHKVEKTHQTSKSDQHL